MAYGIGHQASCSPRDTRALLEKRIVVTGSSMGIGRAVALRLAREGARIVINGRHREPLGQALAEIAAAGGEVVASAGSVADYEYAGELVGTCIDRYGGIDVLINCAGIAEPYGTSILDIDPVDWRSLVDVHLHGTFNTCRQAASIMAGQGRGAIVNTSSHAFLGMYGGTGYAAGKGATNSLSQAMAIDLEPHGIDVNVVCPGARTRLSTGDDYVKLIESLHRRGALSDERRDSALNPASPDQVASLYAYLASELAAGITGQLFWGSGGYVGRFGAPGQQVLAAPDTQSAAPVGVAELAAALAAAERACAG